MCRCVCQCPKLSIISGMFFQSSNQYWPPNRTDRRLILFFCATQCGGLIIGPHNPPYFFLHWLSTRWLVVVVAMVMLINHQIGIVSLSKTATFGVVNLLTKKARGQLKSLQNRSPLQLRTIRQCLIWCVTGTTAFRVVVLAISHHHLLPSQPDQRNNHRLAAVAVQFNAIHRLSLMTTDLVPAEEEATSTQHLQLSQILTLHLPNSTSQKTFCLFFNNKQIHRIWLLLWYSKNTHRLFSFNLVSAFLFCTFAIFFPSFPNCKSLVLWLAKICQWSAHSDSRLYAAQVLSPVSFQLHASVF